MKFKGLVLFSSWYVGIPVSVYLDHPYLIVLFILHSSLIPEEICHMAFVASVEVIPPFDGKGRDSTFSILPDKNCTELPDCMVCLERMDESVRGILTVLCNHSFHAHCLQQWEDLW